MLPSPLTYPCFTRRSRILVPLDFPASRVLYIPVLWGLAAAQVGIVVFNVGLTKGLSKLGSVVGGTMPSAFTAMESVQGGGFIPHEDALYTVHSACRCEQMMASPSAEVLCFRLRGPAEWL